MEGSANDFLIEHMHGGSSGIVDTQGMATSLLIIGCLLVFVDLSRCLRMEMLDVPTAANQGESIELSCIYDLENDRLYSIKWYKNDVEFYRYVPNDWPPGQFLPLPGVRVDLSKSGKRSVYLRSVDLNSTGTYRCEVSAEAPSFQSVEAERELNVMVLPTEGPRITGGQPKYNVGDTVAINCTSAKSKPAATLRWFINDQPIGPEYDTEHSTTLHEDGLETSSLSLKFVARDKHFLDHTMRLRCTASISRMYTMSNEELFMGGRQQSSTLQIHENESREKPIKGSSNPKRKGQKQRVDVEKKHHALVEYSETIPEARFNVTSGPDEDPITETEQFFDNNSVDEGEDTTQKSSIVYFTMQSTSFSTALYSYHWMVSFMVMATLLRVT